ncbi:MAG TPA: hypothetical protein VGH19_22845 [Verrucomicrobiae bacterium]
MAIARLFIGPLEGKEFTAEKPFIFLGWPDEKPAHAFDTLEELKEFVKGATQRNPAVPLGKAYEFKDTRWQPVDL